MDTGRLTQTMLLDLYGELLTEKQRACFDLHCNEDLSLSEIAEQLSITRQGVWDNIRRAETALNEYEEKTGLLRRPEHGPVIVGARQHVGKGHFRRAGIGAAGRPPQEDPRR